MSFNMKSMVVKLLLLNCFALQGMESRHGFLWYEDPTWNEYISLSQSLWMKTFDSKVMCAFECYNDTTCETFFYSPISRECQAHSSTITFSIINAVPDVGSRYYKVKCKGGQDYRYVREFDFCFKIYFMDDILWQEAQNHCAVEHGWLIELNTYQKALWFISYLNDLSSGEKKTFWNGMTDENSEGTFIWHTRGVIHPYQSMLWNELWKDDQPDNANGDQNCGILKYVLRKDTYQLDDYNCHKLNKKHICECEAV